MGWYDWFASVYDSSLEALYADARASSAAALELATAKRVLDLPTGTGQSLGPLLTALPKAGRVVGADLSSGMLKRAEQRVARNGWSDRVELIEADVHAIELEPVDRLHVFLGLTAFPDYEEAFSHLWDLLEPGGRAVIVDVHAVKPGFQGKMVNLVAQADITRRAWEPLERLAEGFSRVELPSNRKYGGVLWLASGTKPV